MTNSNLARTVGKLLLAALAVWATLALALPLLLPFAVGMLLAWLIEPVVQLMTRRGRVIRAFGSIAALLVLYGLLGLLLWLLLRRAGFELTALTRELPALVASLAGPAQRVRSWVASLAARAPDSLGQVLTAYADSLFAGGAAMMARASEKTLLLLTGLVSRLPGILLGLFTAVLSSFFISLELPAIRRLFAKLPGRWAQGVRTAVNRVRRALGGWLRAQVKLAALTFCIVTTGLFLIGLDVALVMGFVVALVDSLPVFGSGTILLPWAALCFLRGDTTRGIELAVLYAIAALTRQVLEPRLVGRQMGLSPLLTLMAIYVGFRLFGIAGMILLPITAMIVRQFLGHGGENGELAEQS